MYDNFASLQPPKAAAGLWGQCTCGQGFGMIYFF